MASSMLTDQQLWWLCLSIIHLIHCMDPCLQAWPPSTEVLCWWHLGHPRWSDQLVCTVSTFHALWSSHNSTPLWWDQTATYWKATDLWANHPCSQIQSRPKCDDGLPQLRKTAVADKLHPIIYAGAARNLFKSGSTWLDNWISHSIFTCGSSLLLELWMQKQVVHLKCGGKSRSCCPSWACMVHWTCAAIWWDFLLEFHGLATQQHQSLNAHHSCWHISSRARDLVLVWKIGYQCRWPVWAPTDAIFIFESLTVSCAIHLATQLTHVTCLLITTDNTNTFDMFASLRAQPIYNPILMSAVDVLLKHKLNLQVFYLPGPENFIADT